MKGSSKYKLIMYPLAIVLLTVVVFMLSSFSEKEQTKHPSYKESDQ